jgi:hypothetical protein
MSTETKENGLDILYRAAAAAFESNNSENDTTTITTEPDDDIEKLQTCNKITMTAEIEEANIIDKLGKSKNNCKNEMLVTFSPIAPQYEPTTSESRLEYLCRFPELLQAAINSSNLEMLRYILDESVTEDLLTTIDNMYDCRGREKWYLQSVAILNSVPDFYVAFTKPMLFRRCICMKQYCYGTTGVLTGLNSSPQTDYLWNPFKAIPFEKMDERMKEYKVLYDKCMSEGKLVRFVKRSFLFLILNEEMTHIEQRVAHCESFELFEANIEDYFKN